MAKDCTSYRNSTLLNIDIDETGQKIYGLATEEQVFIYDIPKELI